MTTVTVKNPPILVTIIHDILSFYAAEKSVYNNSDLFILLTIPNVTCKPCLKRCSQNIFDEKRNWYS